jgi:diguanylate cyclase (GGDEF)-like protein
MPRPPLQRTLFALLPIVGALLAALAGYERWPIALSLLAMTAVASASAVIYWSAPLKARKNRTVRESALVEESGIEVIAEFPISAAPEVSTPERRQSQDDLTISAPVPEPADAGTRAEALATGRWHDTDLLTGLLNPNVFVARIATELERCRAANQTAILIVIDLNSFAAINEAIGLVDANRLLRHVADCFRLTVREGDVLARLGGDEFGIFFPGLPPEIAETRARDLRAAVREAGLQVLEEGSSQVTACLGMASFPADGESVDTLLAAANTSLTTAKHERQEGADKPTASVLVLTRS